jgi:hypothetical protein
MHRVRNPLAAVDQMSAADFGILADRPRLQTVKESISKACADIYSIGVEDDRSDAAHRLDSIVSLRGVVKTVGQTMLDCHCRVSAAGVLADAIKEIERHVTASRTELSSFE